MSLGIVIKGTEGVVLAADSRVTLTTIETPVAGKEIHRNVNFDNATKMLIFREPNEFVGAVTFGDAVIGTTASDLRTIASYLPEFEVTLAGGSRLSIKEFSEKLSEFFLTQWNAKMAAAPVSTGIMFVVAGYDEGAAYGSEFSFNIPNTPAPVEVSANDFGVSWGGQGEICDRIVNGFDGRLKAGLIKALGVPITKMPALDAELAKGNLGIPYQFLPLQDCIDLAVFLIRTTSMAQNLSVGLRGVGGEVDVTVITPEGRKIIKQKGLSGDRIY